MRALLVILLLGCGCGAGIPRGSFDYSQADAPVVAFVEEGRVYCAGVSLPEGVLTAAHCVLGRDALFVAFSGDVSRDGLAIVDVHPARTLRLDEVADLALVAVREAPTPASLGTQPAPGDEVVLCGHPTGLPFVCHTGRVSGRLRHGFPSPEREGWYTLDAGNVPGMSGGPVYDRHGQVVGISSFLLGTPVVGGAIDPETIAAFLRSP